MFTYQINITCWGCCSRWPGGPAAPSLLLVHSGSSGSSADQSGSSSVSSDGLELRDENGTPVGEARESGWVEISHAPGSSSGVLKTGQQCIYKLIS